ncbi:MAG: TetR/AcrR family transcriptional regulator [Microscillaceae bacterium]|nr:TetR/AcrR family transcriptional regulator [Microscillaceae bacterium]
MEIDLKEKLKENILNTSENLFRKYGIRSVTMSDIAHELGISKKTIYQYYKDKNEIVCLMIERVHARDLRDIHQIQQQAENAIDGVLKMNVHFQKIYGHTNPSMVYDIEKYHPEAWLIAQKYDKEGYLRSILENLERGIAEGFYRKEINTAFIAIWRIEQFNLACNEKIFPRDQFDLWSNFVEMTELFLRGIVTLEGFQLLEKYKNQQNHE